MVSRRLAALLAVAVISATAACTSTSALRERAARAVPAAGIVDASYTASLTGTTSHVMLPSGRADLTLTAPVTQLPAQQVADARPRRAAAGHRLVGVGWQLVRSVHADSVPSRDITSGLLLGAPQTVRLWLVTDGTKREIPNVDTLLTAHGRQNTAVWLSVPAGVTSWRFEIDYRGVTQTADARTGRVLDRGRAAPLYAALPDLAAGSCRLPGRATECSIDAVTGFPYVASDGWAPAGHTWSLLELTVGTQSSSPATRLVLDGQRPQGIVNDGDDQYTAFAVPAGRTTLRLSGSSVLNQGNGVVVRVPITGTVPGVTS